jgi:hypothetical protein
MLRRRLQRSIALLVVLAMAATAAVPAWANLIVLAPGHHFAIETPSADSEKCRHYDASGEACGGTHETTTVTHHDCEICLGIALPTSAFDPVRKLPAGFEVEHQIDGTGVPSDLDPYPPRPFSHRV